MWGWEVRSEAELPHRHIPKIPQPNPGAEHMHHHQVRLQGFLEDQWDGLPHLCLAPYVPATTISRSRIDFQFHIKGYVLQ